MADNNVILNFRQKALLAAKRTAERIKLTTGKINRELRARGVRNEVPAALPGSAQAASRANEAERRAALGVRAGGLRGRELPSGESLRNRIFGSGNSFREKIPAFARGLSGDVTGLSGGLSALSEGLPGVAAGLGPIAAVAGAVAAIVLPELQRQLDRRLASFAAASRVQLEEALREADVERRIKEDPRFNLERSQRAFRSFLREEQIAAESGMVRGGQTLQGLEF